jgi:hypothetical protein
VATLQFYKNQYRYPHYSNSLTSYGAPMECTPVGMNFKSGTLRVKGDMLDFMSCNYLAFTRDGITLYAWIDDVKFRTEDSFEVTYSVDGWRTYKSKINLGTQFVARQPQATSKRDPLLGRSVDYPEISVSKQNIGSPTKRIFVVQVRAGSGEIFSRSPVNPTPYQFFMVEYDLNNWTATTALDNLMSNLSASAETQNIVTMYSIPYMNISGLTTNSLPILRPSGVTQIEGFKMLRGEDPKPLLSIETPIYKDMTNMDSLLRVSHSVSIVIPEAGIISIPDELLVKSDLVLRQDVDLFSGASNYMLGAGGTYYTQSARGSSISSIPIVSDPLDTYLSQNQNALATSLIGDVASIAGGMALSAGLGPVGTAIGAGSAMQGVNNIINRGAGLLDKANATPSNPPAFLGTALASNFNQTFWVITSKTGVENDVAVHENFGYPINLIKPLVFPTSGFIQTEGCAVMSTDGSVPRWALDDINANFNNGILVH